MSVILSKDLCIPYKIDLFPFRSQHLALVYNENNRAFAIGLAA